MHVALSYIHSKRDFRKYLTVSELFFITKFSQQRITLAVNAPLVQGNSPLFVLY